jgi:hypothetical protein
MGLILGRGKGLFAQRLDRVWGLPSLLSNGYQGLFPPGIKRQGREADHSSASNDEDMNASSSTSTSPYVFMEWCLIKNKEILILLPYL